MNTLVQRGPFLVNTFTAFSVQRHDEIWRRTFVGQAWVSGLLKKARKLDKKVRKDSNRAKKTRF